MTPVLKPFQIKTPEQFHEMDDEYKDLLIHQLMVHTEGELSGADDYVELFYPLAPNGYEKKVCCERAAEEVDHYLKGAKVLADIGIDTSYMLKQTLEERNLYATEAVKKIDSWPERALFSFLGEGVVMDILLEMAEGSYEPMAAMFPEIIREEKVHVAHGYRITRELCDDKEGKKLIQEALGRWWPTSLDIFGRSDSPRSELYIKYGLRKYGNEEARQRYIAATKPKLEKLGLECPLDTANRKFI